jgi:hypothetical protein
MSKLTDIEKAANEFNAELRKLIKHAKKRRPRAMALTKRARRSNCCPYRFRGCDVDVE